MQCLDIQLPASGELAHCIDAETRQLDTVNQFGVRQAAEKLLQGMVAADRIIPERGNH